MSLFGGRRAKRLSVGLVWGELREGGQSRRDTLQEADNTSACSSVMISVGEMRVQIPTVDGPLFDC